MTTLIGYISKMSGDRPAEQEGRRLESGIIADSGAAIARSARLFATPSAEPASKRQRKVLRSSSSSSSHVKRFLCGHIRIRSSIDEMGLLIFQPCFCLPVPADQ